MEAVEVTEFVKLILVKSEALPYCAHFKGINDEKFKNYSFEDFKHVLPSNEEGELIAAGIKAQVEVAAMMEKLKADKRAGGDVSRYFQTSEIDDEAADVDYSEAEADGVNVEIVPHESSEIEVVTLDSDPEEVDQPQENPKSCISSVEDKSDSEYLSTESSESDESDANDGPCPKRPRPIELALTTKRPVRAHKAKIQPVVNVGSSRNSTHKCTGLTKKGQRNQRWYDEIHGRHCTTINAYQWCWKPLSHRCKKNLFRILCNSPNIEKLNLFNDAAAMPADVELPEGSLPKLKKLRVHRRRKMDTGNVLRTILKMATNLKGFEYKFSTETEEDLGLLGDFDWSNLQRLSVFSLSSPSYLTKAHVESLLRVGAPQLKELRMGIGLYEDVSGELMENLLKNFSTIQNLFIPGQYYSHTDAHLDVTINFPKLSQLRCLNFGGSHYYPAIWADDENDDSSSLKQASTLAKPSHVTLKFCRIFSRLTTLILGNLCHIDCLNLQDFPRLETFLVGSSWHLSVVFREKKNRNYSYPLITELQLPDGLKDVSFLRNIPQRFPNVKICRLVLPSAIVLRTFFNVMKDTELKKLYLYTQFDFSSTLESCLLDKVRPIKNCSEDGKRVTELEKCVKWNDFVDQHNIILPLRNDEEVQAFVEATGDYGLGAMKHLDKFYLSHIPKIVCLPPGESNNEAATTSTVKLGYVIYPISTDCCDVVRRTSNRFWWDLEEPAGEREKWKEAGCWSSTDSSSSDDDDDLVETEASSAMKSSLKIDKKEEE